LEEVSVITYSTCKKDKRTNNCLIWNTEFVLNASWKDNPYLPVTTIKHYMDTKESQQDSFFFPSVRHECLPQGRSVTTINDDFTLF